MNKVVHEYRERGFSVIPIKPDKKPYIKWAQYQEKKPTEKELAGWFSKWPEAQIGIVTGAVSGVCAVDIDDMAAMPAVEGFLSDSVLYPTATTPRGGQHIYFKSPGLSSTTGFMPGVDYRDNGGYVIAPPSRNKKGCYEWMPDLGLDNELSELPGEAQALIQNCSLRGGNTVSKGSVDICVDIENKIFTLGRRDNDLFEYANSLVKSGMPATKIYKLLEYLINSWGEKPDSKWINEKIQSALKRKNSRENSLASDVKQWVMSTECPFMSTDVHKELGIYSRKDQKNIIEILLRLCDEKLLERGKRHGEYKRRLTETEVIDFINVSEDYFNIKWPLNIERYVKTMSKNIIVVAGCSNSGKTAFLLNTAFLNMNSLPVTYFSSEMGAHELQSRLIPFKIPLKNWNVNFLERCSNFPDVIQPDGLNIIDFLEVHDEFYKIGGFIKDIYDRLNKGVCIIALQKNPDKDFGLGGQRSIEKSRLYLAMDPGKIKIVKAKNWRTHENPNGLKTDFKLLGGCKFVNNQNGSDFKWIKD